MTDLNTNIEKAQSYLARFRQDGVLNHINGQAVGADSGEQFEVISPIDLEPIAKVARGGASDIDKAAKAAKASFAAWAAMPGKERKKLLHRIANAIEARAEEIAFVESVDTGQAIRFMSKAALRGAENFRFFLRIGHPWRGTANLCAHPTSSMSPAAPQSAPWASSPRGTRPLCSPPGKLPRPWPQAAPSCTSQLSFHL